MPVKKIIMAVLAAALLICAGCSFVNEVISSKSDNEAVVYSEGNALLLEALVHEYNGAQEQYKISIAAGDTSQQPDIYLLEHSRLAAMQQQNKLLAFELPEADALPQHFKSEENYWYGVFYDPAVLLINQNFARRVGQENIRTWEDLLRISNINITLENLSDNDSTRNFLYAFASHWGEDNALGYLRELHKHIGQYAKFPFSPIRMAAVGDADIAVTRSSYIFEYLENSFPAYVAVPVEGTPVNLTAVAISAGSEENYAAVDFCRWLLGGSAVKRILLQQNTGLESAAGSSAKAEALWLNTHYLDSDKANGLINKWLETVRFEN